MAKANAHKRPACTRNLNINQTNSNWFCRDGPERFELGFGIFNEHNQNQLNDQQRRNK